MPRIAADSVAAHVAHQERAVFEAAVELFLDRGYPKVTMGDIASAVGLARTSLYRYFPDKASILLRWYRTEMPGRVERSAELLDGPADPVTRVRCWADAQIDAARHPDHALVAALGQEVEGLDPAVRQELGESHERLLAPLAVVVEAAGHDGADLAATIDLLWGLVLAQARRELDLGDDPAGRAVLARCIATLL